MSGQRRLKLDERQTAEMIKTSAQKPADCVHQLEKSVNMQAKLPTDKTVAAFKMKVAKEMSTVRACHRLSVTVFRIVSGCIPFAAVLWSSQCLLSAI
jgi:hypothetical protein